MLSATQGKGMIPRAKSGIDIKYNTRNLVGYKKVEQGDFVVHLRSFQGGFAYSNLTGIVSPAYTVFSFKSPQYFDDIFWKEKFTSYDFIQLLKKVTYGVRDGRSISYSDFLTLTESFPPYNEQKKIGELFKLCEHSIYLQHKKLKQLKLLKKALLQNLFTDDKYPKIRFNEYSDPWEQSKLGEVADIVGGGTPSTSNPKYWNGTINWYTPAELGSYIYTDKSKRQITQYGYDNSSAKMLPKGTVLFTSRAGIGKTAILLKPSTTNQGFQSIIPKSHILNSYFLYSLSGELKHYGETHGAGSRV